MSRQRKKPLGVKMGCAGIHVGEELCSFIAVVLLSVAVTHVSADVIKCENFYRDFSVCVLELGESMDNYQENVTSQQGVEAVCSHWEAFHTCALTALSGCQGEVASIWETLREDSRKISFQGSLFDLCSSSSGPSLRPSHPALSLLLAATLALAEYLCHPALPLLLPATLALAGYLCHPALPLLLPATLALAGYLCLST